MENQPSTIKSTILQFGTMLGVISVVFGLMIYFLDMHYTQETSIGIVSIVISLGVIVLAQYNYRNENEGFLSLGEALKIGLGVALISGIIGVTYQYLLVNFIDPDTIPKMMEITKNKLMDDNPEMSQEQLDQIISMQEKFTTPGMMVAFGKASGYVDTIDVKKDINAKGLFFTRPSIAHYTIQREELVESAKKVFDAILSKKFTVNISKKYSLENIVEAHKDLEARKLIGPAVIIP